MPPQNVREELVAAVAISDHWTVEGDLDRLALVFLWLGIAPLVAGATTAIVGCDCDMPQFGVVDQNVPL